MDVPKSGLPSAWQGVISAGIVPEKIWPYNEDRSTIVLSE